MLDTQIYPIDISCYSVIKDDLSKILFSNEIKLQQVPDIQTNKIHNQSVPIRIPGDNGGQPFTPFEQRSTMPSSALSHVSLVNDESSAWIACPPGSQSRLHTG